MEQNKVQLSQLKIHPYGIIASSHLTSHRHLKSRRTSLSFECLCLPFIAHTKVTNIFDHFPISYSRIINSRCRVSLGDLYEDPNLESRRRTSIYNTAVTQSITHPYIPTEPL